MNVEPTAKVIESMAHQADELAIELRAIANKIRDTRNLDYASDAVSYITNTYSNLHIDLLFTRTFRELTK